MREIRTYGSVRGSWHAFHVNLFIKGDCETVKAKEGKREKGKQAKKAVAKSGEQKKGTAKQALDQYEKIRRRLKI